MLFQPELGWSVLELLGRFADSVRWTPLQKQETKRIDGGSPVTSPMPKSVLSGGREDQLLREGSFVHKSAYLSLMGGPVFIMDDHDNFPNWMVTLNSMFPCWKVIRYFSHWVGDFLSLS